MAVSVAALTTVAASTVLADEAATAVQHEKTYTGRVVSINPQEHMLKAKGWLFAKTFNLGDSCRYNLLENHTGSIEDLRPGQKVTIGYREVNGVRVANRVEQEPMRYTGMVKTVDRDKHTVTVRHELLDRTFRVHDGCKVVLYNDKSGALADVKPGEHVTVTYELPKDKATAQEIEQSSAHFTGSLTAIGLSNRTLAAKSTFGAKRFRLADDCAIVLNGKPGGHLSDLHPDEKLTLSYNDVDGVYVVTRISNAGEPSELETAQVK